MPETLYAIAAIAVVALVTWGLRAAPFLLFGSRPLPKMMRYLGRALPPAIMTVLVIYCLRNTSFDHSPCFYKCRHHLPIQTLLSALCIFP